MLQGKETSEEDLQIWYEIGEEGQEEEVPEEVNRLLEALHLEELNRETGKGFDHRSTGEAREN